MVLSPGHRYHTLGLGFRSCKRSKSFVLWEGKIQSNQNNKLGERVTCYLFHLPGVMLDINVTCKIIKTTLTVLLKQSVEVVCGLLSPQDHLIKKETTVCYVRDHSKPVVFEQLSKETHQKHIPYRSSSRVRRTTHRSGSEASERNHTHRIDRVFEYTDVFRPETRGVWRILLFIIVDQFKEQG